jgi:hypothetical protein
MSLLLSLEREFDNTFSMFREGLFFVILLGVLISLCACQKEAIDEASLAESSEPVILSFDVYNHTQGFLTKIERSHKPGSQVTIKLTDLGVEGVDKNRMVVREHRFGVRVAFSQTGAIQFDAPKDNKNYTLYLLNASNGADYRKVDTWTNANEGVLEYVPPIRWYREDRNDHRGPDSVIKDVIDQLNGALEYSWASYGKFQKIDEREHSSFGLGYGYCRNQFGWHSPFWAGVNPDHCLTEGMKKGTFIEEIFELLTRLNDIGGIDTASLITDPDTGNLNEMGKDLLAYVFVKDEKI